MMQTQESINLKTIFEETYSKQMTPTRKVCHWKGIQEITSLADSTLMMYLSPHVNIDCIAKLRDILKSDLQI